MEVVTAVVAWALSSAGFSMPDAGNWLDALYPRGSSPNWNMLQSELSSSAQLYFPNSTEFGPATARWSVLDEPTAEVVVVPGTENDVAVAVSVVSCNSIDIRLG